MQQQFSERWCIDLAADKRKKMLKIIIPSCIICLILIIAVIFVSSSFSDKSIEYTLSEQNENGLTAKLSSSISPDKTTEYTGHRLVAENENYELYLQDVNLSIIIRDKNTGSIIESTVSRDDDNSNPTWKGFMNSGISIELQEDTNTLQKKIDILGQGATVLVELVPGGFKAMVDYPKYEFGYMVEVLLYDDGSLVVSIPEDSVYENNKAKYQIGGFYVYPFLGRTYLGEREGYMLVPDGNGALIHLNDKHGRFSEGYSQSVYGEDVGTPKSTVLSLLWGELESHNPSELILAPYYGMVHTDTHIGYLAIIEKGDQDATIEATPNGAYTSYNWIGARFRKAVTYKQRTSDTAGGSVTKVTDRFAYDIQVRYIFVNGEEADYSGLANRYRDYLYETGGIAKKEDTFNIRLDFMGSDVESWLLFKKNVTMTTTDNIKEIYDELEDENVTQILSLYKGWQSGGIWNLPVNKYNVNSSLGGNSKLKELLEETDNKDIQIYLYQDVLRINPSTATTIFSTVQGLDKREYAEEMYKDVYERLNFLLPNKMSTNLNKLIESFLKNDIKYMAVSGISNTLYTHMKDNVIYTRKDTLDSYKTNIAYTDEKMNLLLEQPIAPYWKYTDAIIDMPVKDSDYIYMEESIPFLSMVLKGTVSMYSDYVNFEANKTEFFLKLIETGIYPSFYLTYENPADLIYTNSNDIYSSKYSMYKSMIVEYYKELKAFNELVEDSYIIKHICNNNLTIVTYDNGIKVYVNYSSTDKIADGLTIPALSYKIGGAQ